MAKLILESNEYTVVLFLEHIQRKYKLKSNGSSFSVADIHDWANKGKIPKQYGGQYISFVKLGPLKILRLTESISEGDRKAVEIVKNK